MTQEGISAALRRAICVAACAALVSSSSAALAQQAAFARLTQIEGTVLVDVGDGFVQAPADEEIGLQRGHRVLVADDGAAVLDFGDDCAFQLAAPSMTTVTETACTVATQNNGFSFVPVVLTFAAMFGGGLYLYLRKDEQPGSP